MAIIIALAVILLIPHQACAWGGGMHLQVGLSMLDNLALFPASVAALLTRYPLDYLYGCIAADITLGKKYTHQLLNCHRWGVGRKMLQAARTDSEKACALGYLSHLAADVIAHNYYVPFKIMRTFATITMKHTYWEMRYETFVGKDVWRLARVVCRNNQQANDELMRSVLTPTLFSFATNKRVFNSIMLLSRLERWQRIMQTISKTSRYVLTAEDREEYLGLTKEAVIDFLQRPEDSELLLADPTGERALAMAEAVRKNMRMLYKSGRLSKEDGLQQVDAMRDTLRGGILNPDLLNELHHVA